MYRMKLGFTQLDLPLSKFPERISLPNGDVFQFRKRSLHYCIIIFGPELMELKPPTKIEVFNYFIKIIYLGAPFERLTNNYFV